jgi:uncharacterized protein (TIGR02246 family)
MTPTQSDQDVHAVAATLTDAWNAHDAKTFASAFTADADFVNIYAMHVVGRADIARLHQMIFDTVYRGSSGRFAVEKMRSVGEDVLVAHIKAELNVPQGPSAGTVPTLATAVLVRDDGNWKIASFQNTREQAPPPLDPPASS